MPWRAKKRALSPWDRKPRKLVFLSFMTTLALVLQILESIIPNPVPWIRIGLANVVILIVLSLYGIREGLMVTVLRVILASILLGSIFGPTFWLSLSGGVSSTIAMGLLYHFFSRTFSIVGISLVGAYVHNIIQLTVAALFVIGHAGLLYLLPIFLVTSFVAGSMTGLTASLIVERMDIIP